MTVQQAIEYLKHKFPNVWENETLEHEELLTMLWDFYEMGYDNGKANGYNDGYDDGEKDGYEQGYDEGYNMCSEEWAMELSNKHLT